jgi:hypothetical protein
MSVAEIRAMSVRVRPSETRSTVRSRFATNPLLTLPSWSRRRYQQMEDAATAAAEASPLPPDESDGDAGDADQSDGEESFVGDPDEEDDEETLREQMQNGGAEEQLTVEEEVALLEKENEMSVEEIRAMSVRVRPCANTPRCGAKNAPTPHY